MIVFGKVGGLGGVSVMSDATLEFSDGYLCGNWIVYLVMGMNERGVW